MKYIPYMKTYDTRRLWVEETDKGFEVILNETIFQPRSEFYPSDRGIISGIAVEEVFVRPSFRKTLGRGYALGA